MGPQMTGYRCRWVRGTFGHLPIHITVSSFSKGKWEPYICIIAKVTSDDP